MSTEAMVARSADQAQALALRGEAGTLALALMPEEEFEQRLVALKRGQERIRRIKREMMVEGVHFGVIPGTDKPTLLKPGAEVLCSIYGLRPDFIATAEYGDGVISPPVRVTIRCELHVGDLAGPVVAVGVGACNSWEKKYRYRRGERACPECGSVGCVIKGKAEYGGGWLCWAKRGGCGAKFAEADERITSQSVADIENPDQHDLENTLLKIGKKRAHIDAALTGTASSDLFTQDLEEMEPPPEPPAQPKGRTAAAQPRPPQHSREPGSDDEEVETSRGPVKPGSGQHAAEAGAKDYRPAPPKGPKGQANATMPTCPLCKQSRSVMASKYEGGGWYCRACKKAWRTDTEESARHFADEAGA